MDGKKDRVCRECGTSQELVHISSRGYCTKCAAYRMAEASRQMRLKEGHIYEKWKAHHRTALAQQLAKKSD